ncbi:hypothetical protein HK405_007638 [Cladochytrium tenue]|nr:hypothetical protein HK405_007638 [Cladochytrium tenue]
MTGSRSRGRHGASPRLAASTEGHSPPGTNDAASVPAAASAATADSASRFSGSPARDPRTRSRSPWAEGIQRFRNVLSSNHGRTAPLAVPAATESPLPAIPSAAEPTTESARSRKSATPSTSRSPSPRYFPVTPSSISLSIIGKNGDPTSFAITVLPPDGGCDADGGVPSENNHVADTECDSKKHGGGQPSTSELGQAIEELEGLLKEIANEKTAKGRKTSVNDLRTGLKEIGERMNQAADGAVSEEGNKKISDLFTKIKDMAGDGEDPFSNTAEWFINKFDELLGTIDDFLKAHVILRIGFSLVTCVYQAYRNDKVITEQINEFMIRVADFLKRLLRNLAESRGSMEDDVTKTKIKDAFLYWTPRPLRDRFERLSEDASAADEKAPPPVVLHEESVKSKHDVMTSLHEKLQPIEVDSLGDAWSGKSVFFACTVDEFKRDHATAVFVCDYSDPNLSDARRAIATLASQITKFVDDQAKVSMDKITKQEVQSLSLSNLFERLITQPLKTLNGARITIAIDALDELRADVDELCLTGRTFDLSPQFKWRKNLDFSSDFKSLWVEKFDLNVIDAEAALFQGCVDVLVDNRSLFDGREALIVGGLQDPPTEDKKEVAYACRHWYSHFKATAANLLSSQDLVEFLAVNSFGPGLLVRGVRDNDDDVIQLAFGCSHDGHTGHSESEKAKNCQLAAEASKILPSPLLHEAAKRNHAGICRLLLDCGGVEVNAVGPRPASGTALHAAAQARADDVFGLLLDKGVNPHVLDANGRTASDLYPEYFEMLEKKSKRKEVLQS